MDDIYWIEHRDLTPSYRRAPHGEEWLEDDFAKLERGGIEH